MRLAVQWLATLDLLAMAGAFLQVAPDVSFSSAEVGIIILVISGLGGVIGLVWNRGNKQRDSDFERYDGMMKAALADKDAQIARLDALFAATRQDNHDARNRFAELQLESKLAVLDAASALTKLTDELREVSGLIRAVLSEDRHHA